MLEDVRQARPIDRVRFEVDGEDIILIVSVYMQVFCTSLVMFQLQRSQMQFRHVLHLLKCEAMEAISGRET